MNIFSTSDSPRSVVGVSSWALHGELGNGLIWGVEAGREVPAINLSGGALSLLEMPQFLADRSFDTLQICHFHLAARDESYLNQLREAIASSGLSLHALLVDEGDLTHPQLGARDEAWIADWLPVAAQLGARYVRVIAGKTSDDGALERSALALNRLAQRAEPLGVKIMTENWFDLLASPDAVDDLLGRCAGKVEFLLDFSNWSGPDRFDNLARIAPHAVASHVHSSFVGDAQIDADEFEKCLNLPFAADFCGPHILVNGGAKGILCARDFIREYYQAKVSIETN